jgi:hypothetical protein
LKEKAEELIDIYLEQANIFSAVVGIMGVRALDSLSPYKRHKHPDIAQQRFPDLSLRGKLDPPPKEALESKGSSRPWAIQSHYDHPGWYIVWRYAVDPTKRMKRGRHKDRWQNSHVRNQESSHDSPASYCLSSATDRPLSGQAVPDGFRDTDLNRVAAAAAYPRGFLRDIEGTSNRPIS